MKTRVREYLENATFYAVFFPFKLRFLLSHDLQGRFFKPPYDEQGIMIIKLELALIVCHQAHMIKTQNSRGCHVHVKTVHRIMLLSLYHVYSGILDIHVYSGMHN